MQTRLVDVTFNAPFTPMCSERTGFGQLLTDLSREHRETSSAALALKHPAFCVETKLDGERMLVHYTAATGQVRMHTRRGNWYRYVLDGDRIPVVAVAVLTVSPTVISTRRPWDRPFAKPFPGTRLT